MICNHKWDLHINVQSSACLNVCAHKVAIQRTVAKSAPKDLMKMGTAKVTLAKMSPPYSVSCSSVHQAACSMMLMLSMGPPSVMYRYLHTHFLAQILVFTVGRF